MANFIHIGCHLRTKAEQSYQIQLRDGLNICNSTFPKFYIDLFISDDKDIQINVMYV